MKILLKTKKKKKQNINKSVLTLCCRVELFGRYIFPTWDSLTGRPALGKNTSARMEVMIFAKLQP